MLRQGWSALCHASAGASAGSLQRLLARADRPTLLLTAPSAAAAGLHTSAAHQDSSTGVSHPPGVGIIEIRSYTVNPADFATYVGLTTSYADVRKELLPFLGMFTCEVGSTLNKLVHLYAYQSYEERESVRRAAARDPRWMRFITEGRKYVQHQSSFVFREAAPVYQALQLPATGQFKSPPKDAASTARPTYEFRQYQLHAGYGSVPKLVEAFAKGLPAKVQADPAGSGKLVLFGHTEVGTLNQVVELWRFNSTTECIKAREASRKVVAWKEAIAAVTPGVVTFSTEFLHPTVFSPWQ